MIKDLEGLGFVLKAPPGNEHETFFTHPAKSGRRFVLQQADYQQLYPTAWELVASERRWGSYRIVGIFELCDVGKPINDPTRIKSFAAKDFGGV
jgi:hypothetical protein